MTKAGVNVVSRKEGLSTLIDGKENPVAKMVVGIMATLAEFELERIRQRRQEGIAKAKERGAYKNNGGRTQETIEQFFAKKRSISEVGIGGRREPKTCYKASRGIIGYGSEG